MKEVTDEEIRTEYVRGYTGANQTSLSWSAFRGGWRACERAIRCPACGGNDKDAPCAYPEGGQPGCFRDRRLGRNAGVAVDAMKRHAAEKVVIGVEAGRQAFRDGKPREAMATEAHRIGWDEAEYDATHGVRVPDEAQAFRDWMAQWPEHSERDRLKMFSAFKAGIAAASGVPAVEPPKRWPLPIKELLAIYDQCKGDWCAIVREVEHRHGIGTDGVRVDADAEYYQACERQNVALLEAMGYPHEKDTMTSPEEYAAELKRKADAFDALGVDVPANGWRPISTAPRDGSRILLWWKYRPARVGWWTDEESGTGWKCDGDVVVPCAAAQSDATHWQPVPVSPFGVNPCDGGQR